DDHRAPAPGQGLGHGAARPVDDEDGVGGGEDLVGFDGHRPSGVTSCPAATMIARDGHAIPRRNGAPMPGQAPPLTDERALLLAYNGQQRDGIRNAAYGLTDEQARLTPSASTLSIGGILKHVADTERG